MTKGDIAGNVLSLMSNEHDHMIVGTMVSLMPSKQCVGIDVKSEINKYQKILLKIQTWK